VITDYKLPKGGREWLCISMKRLPYFINGEFKESKTTKYMDAFNPSTGEVIAQVPTCTAQEVEDAIAAAKAIPVGPVHRLSRECRFYINYVTY